MKNVPLTVFALCLLILPIAASAESVRKTATTEEVISTFRLTSEVLTVDTIVPTVHEYPLASGLERMEVSVYDATEGAFVYSTMHHDEILMSERSIITTSHTGVEPGLHDLDSKTVVDFSLPEDGEGSVEITYRTKEPFVSSQYYYQLAPNVAKPKTIAIYATNDSGVEEIVLAPSRPHSSGRTRFPETVSNNWRVEIVYTQPLRLSEAALILAEPEFVLEQHVRFLGEPRHEYQLFADPDRTIVFDNGEHLNLSEDGDLKIVVHPVSLSANQYYIPADRDQDGVADTVDNCMSVKNTDQHDFDNNGKGDACEDYDLDGLINSIDNCPDDPNRRQADEDGDGVGDACDDDESRLTEKYAWIPWVSLGFAVLVMLSMFMIVLRRPEEVEEGNDMEKTGDETVEPIS